MTKQCGNCKWWDRNRARVYGAIEKPTADCFAPVPDSVLDQEKVGMTETEGQCCTVYKELKQ